MVLIYFGPRLVRWAPFEGHRFVLSLCEGHKPYHYSPLKLVIVLNEFFGTQLWQSSLLSMTSFLMMTQTSDSLLTNLLEIDCFKMNMETTLFMSYPTVRPSLGLWDSRHKHDKITCPIVVGYPTWGLPHLSLELDLRFTRKTMTKLTSIDILTLARGSVPQTWTPWPQPLYSLSCSKQKQNQNF